MRESEIAHILPFQQIILQVVKRRWSYQFFFSVVLCQLCSVTNFHDPYDFHIFSREINWSSSHNISHFFFLFLHRDAETRKKNGYGKKNGYFFLLFSAKTDFDNDLIVFQVQHYKATNSCEEYIEKDSVCYSVDSWESWWIGKVSFMNENIFKNGLSSPIF